jgi:hypothetical protein
VDLDELLAQQQHSICRRRPGMGYGTGRAYTRTPDGNLSRDHAARKKSVNPVFHTLDEKWAAYLRTLPK